MYLIDCINALNSIRSIGTTKNYQSLYQRVQLQKWLQEQVEFYGAEERKLAEKYGHIEGESIIFNGDKDESDRNAQAFLSEKEKLNAVDVDPPSKFTITKADLNGTALAADTIIALEPFIDFEFMGETNENSSTE